MTKASEAGAADGILKFGDVHVYREGDVIVFLDEKQGAYCEVDAEKWAECWPHLRIPGMGEHYFLDPGNKTKLEVKAMSSGGWSKPQLWSLSVKVVQLELPASYYLLDQVTGGEVMGVEPVTEVRPSAAAAQPVPEVSVGLSEPAPQIPLKVVPGMVFQVLANSVCAESQAVRATMQVGELFIAQELVVRRGVDCVAYNLRDGKRQQFIPISEVEATGGFEDPFPPKKVNEFSSSAVPKHAGRSVPEAPVQLSELKWKGPVPDGVVFGEYKKRPARA